MRALDLVSSISELLGWGSVSTIQGDVETNTRKVIRACNLTLHSMQAQKLWPELETEATLITQADQEVTIQCSINKGSTACNVVGMDALNIIGCLFQVSGYTTVFRVVGATATDITLDRMWVDESINDEFDLLFGRDLYEVPADYDRLKSDGFTNTSNIGADVDVVEEEFLGIISGSAIVPDSPTLAYFGGESPSGRQMIQFNTVPDNMEVYRYKYQRNHPELTHDDMLLKYPVRYHLAIIDTVVSRLEEKVDNKQGNGSQKALEEQIRQNANPSTSEARMRFAPKGRARARRRY